MKSRTPPHHLGKLKVIACVLGELSWPGQLLHKRKKLVVVAPVVVQLNLPNELDLDPMVLNFPWRVKM